jgi:hypothetical protein
MRLRAPHAAALLLLAAACQDGGGGNNTAADEVVTTGGADSRGAEETISVRAEGVEDAGATPMNEREAVLGILNKRNGSTREFKIKPGQAVRVENVIIRLRACDRTAPWEQDQLTGAFVQVDVEQLDKTWRRVFSGWLFKERPALNVVQHGIYDVWPKSCAMTFKDSGPETVTAPAAGGGPSGRSSAKKSPSTTGAPDARPAVDSPSAAPSNET